MRKEENKRRHTHFHTFALLHFAANSAWKQKQNQNTLMVRATWNFHQLRLALMIILKICANILMGHIHTRSHIFTVTCRTLQHTNRMIRFVYESQFCRRWADVMKAKENVRDRRISEIIERWHLKLYLYQNANIHTERENRTEQNDTKILHANTHTSNGLNRSKDRANSLKTLFLFYFFFFASFFDRHRISFSVCLFACLPVCFLLINFHHLCIPYLSRLLIK